MANPNSAIAAEPAALAAERERLIPELLKQSKATTGTVQTALRKMHDVLVQTRPGATADLKIYEAAKAAFVQLDKEPNVRVPPVLLQAVEFLQKRTAAMSGAGGQTQPPKSEQTLPPKSGQTQPPKSGQTQPPKSGPPAPAAAAQPRRATVDGFEMPKRSASSISLVPASGPREPENQGKIEPRPGAPTTIKNPGAGRLKG
ncbi:MAG: hypothetical protein ACJ8AT_15180 [Hyalangium sp.]|uniref:hypothetical protein n=1 Tax=Hyalangium sp. TaxID=2028555 RepID=UPI0038998489